MSSKNFKEGDRILLKLNSGQGFEGDLLKYTRDRLDLTNMLCHETGNKLDSVFSFYKSEIDTILLLTEKKLQREQNSKQTTNTILINREEYERLRRVSLDYIYIKSIDKSYFDTVSELINFESLGVFAIGTDKGRNGIVELLAISNWKQVYIFDLKVMPIKRFPPEIKDILESTYILKVVHNGGTLKDCLENKHKVFMSNVFDTQVADLVVYKNATGRCPNKMRNLSECLNIHLNFPTTVLDSAIESLSEPWDERPLDEQQLLRLSKLVTYLITLKEHFQSLMLKDFFSAVNNYHDLFTKVSNYQMERMRCNDKSTKDIEDIIPAALKISESTEESV